jgi:phage tail-like protein
MRAKDFQFLTINTRSLWESGSLENLDIAEGGLSLHEEFFYALGGRSSIPSLTEPVDLAIGVCNALHILDRDNCRVLIYDKDTDFSEWLRCLGGSGGAPGRLCKPEAIALSPSNLYIADTGNHRIQAFARINLQVRWIVQPLEDSEPVDLAVDMHSNLYILDAANKLVLKVDKNGRWLDTYETKPRNANHLAVQRDCVYLLGTDDEGHSKVGIQFKVDLGDRGDLDAHAILEVLWAELEGRGFLLSDASIVPVGQEGRNWRITDGERIYDVARELNKLNVETIIDLPDTFAPRGLALDEGGNFYIVDNQEAEEERAIYRFSLSGKPIGVISGLPHNCQQLQRDPQGNFYVLEETGEITFLEPTSRFLPRGSYISSALDSGTPELQWHKLVVDAEIPEKTQITLSYYISDDETLPVSPGWSPSLTNPRDALIMSSRGRYLWLKIGLFGDEQRTPRVRSVRAYFPRLSYLRYLPAIYQEDAASRDFLERFLSLFEAFLSNLEEEIFTAARYFDVDATPADELVPERDFLTWLGSWLGATLDESWSEGKKREFLKAAPELYKKRGTREGLQEFIGMCIGEKPIIIEHFQLDCIDNEENKESWAKLFSGRPSGLNPYSFCVLFLPGQLGTTDQVNIARRIVESEKPAHTTAGVTILRPWIYLDMHTYLGINSVLSMPVFRLGITSAISRDTALSDSEKGAQLDRHARVEIDTTLT